MDEKLLVLIGPTASSKSKLAQYLKTNGCGIDLINCDAIQCYEGLPIATNKDYGIGLIGSVSIDDSRQYHVGKYVEDCLALVKKQKNCSMLVGGTYYYAEGVVFENLLSTESQTPNRNKFDIADYAFETLEKIDPSYARRVHRNDSRKIRKALDMMKRTGRLYSEQFFQARKLRFPKTLVLHLGCKDSDYLYKRINERVLKMIDRGLIKEVQEFYKTEDLPRTKGGDLPSEGIFQSIGYKEMRGLCQGNQTLQQCTEQLQASTRRYSQKQLRSFKNIWTREISLFQKDSAIYNFDIDQSKWEDLAKDALQVVQAFLQDKQLPRKHRVTKPWHTQKDLIWKEYRCDTCQQSFNNSHQWSVHINSRKHKKRKRNARKRLRQAENQSIIH